ncbi:MAG TPA: hypothetical protein VGS28_01020 [Candidatus Saccharimonadales bacterium]|nr:hypothetical protein [Candidatus Saccharimonadales bacterium]
MSREQVDDLFLKTKDAEEQAIEGASRRIGITAILGAACAYLMTQASFLSHELQDKIPSGVIEMVGAGLGGLAVLTAIGAGRETMRAISLSRRGAGIMMVIADRMYDETDGTAAPDTRRRKVTQS